MQLVEHGTGRVVGTVDGGRATSTAHPDAVYVHRGDTWVVESLDLDERVAVMRRDDPGHTTTAREVTDIAITGERAHRTWGGCRLSFGDVEVSQQVVSFLKRRQPGGEVIGEETLDLPRRTLATTAVWWTVPPGELEAAGLTAELGVDLPGAAHAAEHCSIGLLPLFATCDRWDIGGVSTALHADTGLLTVFVHDGHPGGAGFAERGFRAARAWLTATRDSRSPRAGATRAAPRASSHPSAATRTTRSTSAERPPCSTCCSPPPIPTRRPAPDAVISAPW